MPKKSREKADPEMPARKRLKDETLRTIWGVIFFVLAIFLLLASFGYPEHDKAGLVGFYTYKALTWLFGIGYFLLPLLLGILGVTSLNIIRRGFAVSKAIGSFLFFTSGLALIHMFAQSRGGIVGSLISNPLIKLFDRTASGIILSALIIISLVIIFDTHITIDRIKGLFIKPEPEESEEEKTERRKRVAAEMDDDEVEGKIMPSEEPAIAAEVLKKAEEKPLKIRKPDDNKETDGMAIQLSPYSGKEYVPPPMSLLERDKGKPGVGDIKANANIIKRTLMNFGIDVEMDEISIGPSVTRYALKPAEGVKLSRIVGLQNDLSLALAAHPLRIEAPIPGKSLVGIEIPNMVKTTVGLGSLLSSEEYQSSEKPLLAALGRGISGKSHFSNVAKMPHLLIAGTTGSGKSVTIHALIVSLLYRNSPENMKFIMIDPKRVELTLYNRIPHLLTPVITDAKKAILALKWAAKEMDRRYDILEGESVRDIDSYHKTVLAPAVKKVQENGGKIEEGTKVPETMPYIVIIIDELADIMTTYPRELEAAIVRLAQMSRAVGIHLILSTQRPSVNVITGLIKANIPSRLALQVSSQIDSRTILDMGGAEKLLGAGDMLFLSGEMAQPQRIQSAYITESETKNVVKYLYEQYKDEIPSEVNMATAEHEKNPIFEGSIGNDADAEDDDMYEDARNAVLEAGKASTSYLQRKLRIGYGRAARLIDILEERGIVGPADGAKPREVISGGGSDEGPINIQPDEPEPTA